MNEQRSGWPIGRKGLGWLLMLPILIHGWLLPAWPGWAAEAEGCSIRFDGDLKTSRGQQPAVSQGVSLIPGKAGQAAFLPAGAALSYPAHDNYTPRRGSIQMWVKPSWDSAQTQGNKVFWTVDPDPGQDNRVTLGCLSNGREGSIYFSNGPAGDAIHPTEETGDNIIVPVIWHADQWHHLAAYWDDAIDYRALYIDGIKRGMTSFSVAMPVQASRFHLGGRVESGGKVAASAEAAIDECKLESDVHNDEYRRLRDTRQTYKKACKRLADRYSLERVGSQRLEVGWEDLQGMARPLSYRVGLQPLHHPEVFFVQPDMSVALGTTSTSLGLGFFLGDPIRFPDAGQVTRKLYKGYQPIVTSCWQEGPIELQQTALGVLAEEGEVVTGREPAYLCVRLAVRNRSHSRQHPSLLVCVGKMGGCQNQFYAPFLASPECWRSEPLGLKLHDASLTMGDRVLLHYRTDGPTGVSFHEALDAGSPKAAVPMACLTNGLRFALELEPGETRVVDLVAAGTSALHPAAMREAMASLTFEAALARASRQYDRALEPGMKLVTPDSRLNDVYKAILLANMGLMVQAPDKPWRMPYQSLSGGTWSWEYAHMVIPMLALGFARQVEPTLRYFTERQAGVGRHAADLKPVGDVKSTGGAFCGNTILWMNDTGSILWALASMYLYTRNDQWLKANAPSMLAAWDWIQRERGQTRIQDTQGQRVRYYGLLPSGPAADQGGKFYEFTFSDSFTYLGMAEMAKAFALAGLPQAARLTLEAEEYRQCILDVLRQEAYTEPQTGLPFLPNTVFCKETNPIEQLYWPGVGPIQLYDTGLLSPNDTRFEPMVEYNRRRHGILMGLTEHYRAGGPEWYPNQTERIYYRCFLGRGEIEKAILVFYSNLVYGMSPDTYQTTERFHLNDPNFTAYQPNGSGNGRILDMIRRMVIDEQEPGRLWLLRGCPRRWFAPGQTISLRDAPTLYGPMSIHTRTERNRITVQLEVSASPDACTRMLVVRHPKRRPIQRATVNGQPVEPEGEVLRLPHAEGSIIVICTY